MKSKLILGAVAGMAVVTALAVAPTIATAETAQTQTRSGGYGLHDGTGNGNGRQASLESKAQVLGMTVDELNTALKTKTMLQIAADKGMTQEQLQTKLRESAAARWQDRGLSAEEIQQRTATQQERQADCDGSGERMGQGGYGQNR